MQLSLPAPGGTTPSSPSVAAVAVGIVVLWRLVRALGERANER